jgi:hypothetical protein
MRWAAIRSVCRRKQSCRPQQIAGLFFGALRQN